MNKVEFNALTGSISINGIIVAPLNLNDFLVLVNSNKIEVEKDVLSGGWRNFGLNVKIMDQDFGLNISFDEDLLYMVWFAWKGGISSRKGYEATENELINDKNKLTRFIEKITGKRPEVTEYTHNVFLYDWGYISTAASLQSVIVTIGVSWHQYLR
jgi:hypothetical protein